MQKKLYFENLPISVSAATLNELFTRVGTVESVTLVEDQKTGKSQGYGFVEMATEAEARTAIQQLNGSELGGNRITVTFAGPAQRKGAGFHGGLNKAERKNR